MHVFNTIRGSDDANGDLDVQPDTCIQTLLSHLSFELSWHHFGIEHQLLCLVSHFYENLDWFVSCFDPLLLKVLGCTDTGTLTGAALGFLIVPIPTRAVSHQQLLSPPT